MREKIIEYNDNEIPLKFEGECPNYKSKIALTRAFNLKIKAVQTVSSRIKKHWRIPDEIWNRKFHEAIDLPEGLLKVLTRQNIETLGEVLSFGWRELEGQPGIGRTNGGYLLARVNEYLEEKVWSRR